MWPVVAMAALSAAQYADQQKRADQQRKLAAKTQELSPWTKMQAGPVEDPSAIGTIGSGVMQGMAMNQQQNAQDEAKAFQQRQLDLQQQLIDAQTMRGAQQYQMGANSSYGVPPQYQNQYQQTPWMYMNRMS